MSFKIDLGHVKKFLLGSQCNLPSKSSRLAPPPVLTWLTLSSVPHLAQQVAVSPPPIIVTVPLVVASTTASITALVPLAKLGNSKTPIGLKNRKKNVRISTDLSLLNNRELYKKTLRKT